MMKKRILTLLPVSICLGVVISYFVENIWTCALIGTIIGVVIGVLYAIFTWNEL